MTLLGLAFDLYFGFQASTAFLAAIFSPGMRPAHRMTAPSIPVLELPA